MKIRNGAVFLVAIMLLGSLIFVSGCADTKNGNGTGNISGNESGGSTAVKAGDTVQIDYTGKLEDGTVFDTSIEETAKQAGIYNANRTYSPLTFVAGAGQMIEGFDEGVIGMKVGEEKTIKIPPEKAYGEYNESLVIPVPLENISIENLKPGQKVPTIYGNVTVVEVNQTHATIDFNNELAGKTLIFDIKVVSIE